MPVIVKAKRSKAAEPDLSDEERQHGQEMLDKVMADPGERRIVKLNSA
jgi:hypothetical protein